MPNWNEVLTEIVDQQNSNPKTNTLDVVRRKYLHKLHEYTKRNVIAYYSGWLSRPDLPMVTSICDEDKNGFMMAIHKLDKTKGLDLILHTPGGDVASAESLIDYLRKIFGKNIRAIVPQMAMSAGTMIACSCKSILMAKHSNLGPVDPQLNGIPAHGIVDEFKRAHEEIKLDQSKIHVWHPILNKYPPTILSRCEHAIKWSEELVQTQLEDVMFDGEENAKDKASKIVSALTDYKGNKAHNRHIHMQECLRIGLKVEAIEDDKELQDLLLTVHHCYMHGLMNTNAIKIIENHIGAAFIKQEAFFNTQKNG